MAPANSHLGSYLNDHLAGAVAALEVLDLIAADSAEPDLARFGAELRVPIAEDRRELETLMQHVGVVPSVTRRMAGWMSEKAAELKVRVDDPTRGTLRRFELLEIVSIGIDGKRALWAALQQVMGPGPQPLDYVRLLTRADEQRRAIEAHRLHWAKAALVAQD